MKSIPFRLPAVFLVVVCLGISACNPCKNVECENGVCSDGFCVCTVGYEGFDCSLRQTTKFIGTYNLSENCTVSGTDTYSCEVSDSTFSIPRLYFSNLRNTGNIVYAVVLTTGDEFEIPNQTFGSASISGNGTINQGGNQITLTYDIVTGTGIENCLGVLILN